MKTIKKFLKNFFLWIFIIWLVVIISGVKSPQVEWNWIIKTINI